MDPVTITIITLFILAMGTSTTVAMRRKRKAQRRLLLQEGLRAHRRIEDQRLSLFDVFWDLGASDFALELMAHHRLLPENDTGPHDAWSRLADLVAQHGDYGDYLEDSLEAIQEFYDEHRHAGHRRRLPGLTEASSRTVPVPKRIESDKAPASAPQKSRPTAADVRERRALRAGRQDPGLMADPTHDEVDLDHVGEFSALDILRSVVDGNLGNQLEKWWKLRRLRQKRQELDEALAELYDFYADVARRNLDFYDPLYDAHQRWRDEATRLRFEARRRPWAGRPWELTADVLFDDAVSLSERLATRAYDTTYHTIETIHDHVRQGNKPMAGYLVFLNRHAFFAGRHPEYADHARRVEYATQRVREEIIKLRDEGLV